MAIKSIVNLSSPLFLGVDQSAEGEVIVTCDKSLKDEAEAFLSHFSIYFELVFGSVVKDAFTDDYRVSMKEFQYSPLKKMPLKEQ